MNLFASSKMSECHNSQMLKKLIYKSHYMGCRENDIIFGKFAKNHLASLNKSDLLLYEDLLKQTDADLWSWINCVKIAPTIFHDLLNKIIKTTSE